MERAILVTADFGKNGGGWTAEERSRELVELATSAGAKVVKEEIAPLKEINSAYFIGSGKTEEIALACKKERIGVVIFNHDLSGTQQKNIEEVVRTKTIDRTQLILDIFARRAHSNEGKLQVELAQLLYLLPRLTGKGIHLSRLGGGIGTRGPGEKKLEVDRRRIRTRIFRLENQLQDLSKRRAMMRKKRERFSVLTIAIIGYTNVGKSTLINALTSSDVIVQDRLFSTLDPTARRFIMPNKQKVIFIDTVGFLDDLPHHLIEAFKATLEEVVEADILLHIMDMSHPKIREQSSSVYEVLDQIGAKSKPVITVLNKADKITDANVAERIRGYFDSPVVISALKKTGFTELINTILAYSGRFNVSIKMLIPSSDARTLNIIYENGLVTKREYCEDTVYVEAEVPVRVRDFLEKFTH